MNTFPTLYHRNKDGSIQQWTITVSGRTITKTYGRKGGALHSVSDTIRSGKNKGRANATTAEEQALSEAKSAWERKQKSGYNRTLSSARGGEVDEKFVKGGIEPMLAKKWEDYSDKVQYPVSVQPKLDGIRCIAVVKRGKCTLWTRTRKPILSVPHIVKAIEDHTSDQWGDASVHKSFVLDGELYNHNLSNDFEMIVSAVRKNEPSELSARIQYHIYDSIGYHELPKSKNGSWKERMVTIDSPCGSLRHVDSYFAENEAQVLKWYKQCRNEGYEGAIVRPFNGLYEHKRSANLLKMKEFDDGEFKIVGVEEGRAAFKGCAIFQCVTKSGKSFSCKMRGTVEELQSLFKDQKKVVGKRLTVRYQGFTNGDVPRFPVGIVIRDYE